MDGSCKAYGESLLHSKKQVEHERLRLAKTVGRLTNSYKGTYKRRQTHRFCSCPLKACSVPEWLACQNGSSRFSRPMFTSALVITYCLYFVYSTSTYHPLDALIQPMCYTVTLCYTVKLHAMLYSEASHSGTLMYGSEGSNSGTLMYGSEGSHSGTLMYCSDGSHSGTLMYGSEGSHSGTLM